MRNRNKVQNWARGAVKLGLLLTDPKVRSTISDTFRDSFSEVSEDLSDKYNDVSKRVSNKYEDVMDRLESVTDRFQPRNPWPSRIGGFLMGAGVGVAVGILFAPAPGSETRDTVSNKVNDMKEKVVQSATNATSKIRSTVTSMPSTGTEG
jgi:gas vesicle protein